MMMNKEYYVVEPDYFNTGILEFNYQHYQKDDSDLSEINYNRPANILSPIQLKFEDEQDNPRITDFMHAKHPVLNNRLLDIIYPLDLYQTQILSASVVDRKGTEHKDYFMWYVYNCIDCVDYSKSGIDPEINNTQFLETLFLDERKLRAIRPDKRLAFRIADSMDKLLIHETLMTKFKLAKVSGCNFVRVEAWGWDKIV